MLHAMTLASCGHARRLLCRRQKQAIIQVVDEMIETTKALSAKTDAEWMDMLREMYPGITAADATEKAQKIIKRYRKTTKHLEDNRDELLKLFGAGN